MYLLLIGAFTAILLSRFLGIIHIQHSAMVTTEYSSLYIELGKNGHLIPALFIPSICNAYSCLHINKTMLPVNRKHPHPIWHVSVDTLLLRKVRGLSDVFSAVQPWLVLCDSQYAPDRLTRYIFRGRHSHSDVTTQSRCGQESAFCNFDTIIIVSSKR